MILKQFVISFLEVNDYLLIDEETREAILIDCTEKYAPIDETLKEYNATLKYVLLTHAHFDHVLGVNDYREKYNCQVLLHKDDDIILQNIDKIMSDFGFGPIEIQQVDRLIDENEVIKFGKHEIKVIHTPGHTPGSVCYLLDDKLFSGDTLFAGSVGRTDLYGGDFTQIKSSIKNKIFQLNDDIKVYPGHGRITSVGNEKATNKFV